MSGFLHALDGVMLKFVSMSSVIVQVIFHGVAFRSMICRLCNPLVAPWCIFFGSQGIECRFVRIGGLQETCDFSAGNREKRPRVLKPKSSVP